MFNGVLDKWSMESALLALAVCLRNILSSPREFLELRSLVIALLFALYIALD